MLLTNYKMSEKEYDMLLKILEARRKKKKTQNLEKLRCAIYARKSQEDIKDTSLDAQISYCKEVIESCDLLELTNIYQEDNVSGYFDDRKEFQNMINEILDKKIDVVVTYDIDRFSRNSGNTFYYRDLIINSGAYVLQANDSNIVDCASSLLAFQIKVLLNDYQGRTSAERTYLTLRDVVKKEGRYVSGVAPYGYEIGPDGKLELNLDESIIVNDIFEKVISGYSLNQIATDLNNSGLRTRKGNLFDKRGLKHIVNNKVYTGTYEYCKDDIRKKKRVAILKLDSIIIKNAFPRIVDDETFNKAQKIVEGNKNIRNNENNHIYLLSGLIKCVQCGRMMIGISTNGR